MRSRRWEKLLINESSGRGLRRNSRRRDRQQAQEQAAQEARQHRENTLFGRNLNPDFARAMKTLSEVGGVLPRIADGLPRTPDAEGYRWLLTRAANHLLPLAHPPSDLRHAINSRRDAWSSINASRERRHENEIRRREEYDRDHGIPARSQATRVAMPMATIQVCMEFFRICFTRMDLCGRPRTLA